MPVKNEVLELATEIQNAIRETARALVAAKPGMAAMHPGDAQLAYRLALDAEQKRLNAVANGRCMP